MLFYTMLPVIYLSFSFTLIRVPFDKFCNDPGSRHAPNLIKNEFVDQGIHPSVDHVVTCNDFPTNIFSNVLDLCNKAHEQDEMPVVVGGDHSCAIPSVFSSQQYCVANNLTLGVLWVDAHADFNTMECSETKNIHGMPVAILCHHTMPSLSIGMRLSPEQFRYVGVRDVDVMERFRMEEYDMQTCSIAEAVKWLDSVDRVHVSWDIDSVDPCEISSVNTPVPGGLSCREVKALFDCICKSKKLIAVDIVEYAPGRDYLFSDLRRIVELSKKILT